MTKSVKHASHTKEAWKIHKKTSKKNNRVTSLAMDLSTHVRLMAIVGHFLPDFDPNSKSSTEFSVIRAIYSVIHMALMSLQFAAMAVETALHFDDMSALTTNAITLLFFLHGPTKVFYFAICRHRFYKTIRSWDTSIMEWCEDYRPAGKKTSKRKMAWEVDREKSAIDGTECSKIEFGGSLMFADSCMRFKQYAVRKMRKLLVSVMSGSAVAAGFWSIRPFLGLGHYGRTSSIYHIQENTTFVNEGISASKLVSSGGIGSKQGGSNQWNLLVDATYPWDTSSGLAYTFTFLYQLYWLVFCLAQINLLDLLFCSWLIFACEQIRHLKDILQPLMELSKTDKTEVISSVSDIQPNPIGVDVDNVFFQPLQNNPRTRFSTTQTIFSVFQTPFMVHNSDTAVTVGGAMGTQRNMIANVIEEGNSSSLPNQVLKPFEIRMFQNNNIEAIVHKATKYWVEKHKHVVRFVECIGDSYGIALLVHMLTSTITLTLLSYEATKISSVDMHAITVVTYLLYTLGQVFLFCIYGNKLIEESTSVMQAAYDSPWYDCTEEAKSFIQIVCQQSQRPMSITGAKFFTVSLDLFASVLGAVVTYFMVLIQLK